MSGTTTNNGGVSITSDTETLAGAVSGAGSFSLSTANLGFNSTVSAGQTINETGLDGLTLKLAQDFLGTINGFGNSGNADTIDATNFVETGTSLNFVENTADTGGTLTLTDGESESQYPDDRPLFEVEFHPRPRQRDRLAGDVRLSRRGARPAGPFSIAAARTRRRVARNCDGPRRHVGAGLDRYICREPERSGRALARGSTTDDFEFVGAYSQSNFSILSGTTTKIAFM